MKASGILMAVLMSIAGGASAADFGELRGATAAYVKARGAGNGVPASPPTAVPARGPATGIGGRSPDYRTSCSIIGNTAHGYIVNAGDSFTIDGQVWFYFYDANMDLVDSEDEYEYEYVSYHENEEVEYTDAPTRATSCSFDVSKAIENGNGPQPPVDTPAQFNYATRCFIKDGKAGGWVKNNGGSFEINGNVLFRFFDENGRLVGEDDDYEYEFVSAGDYEEVESTDSPSNAVSCDFDISKAIKR